MTPAERVREAKADVRAIVVGALTQELDSPSGFVVRRPRVAIDGYTLRVRFDAFDGPPVYVRVEIKGEA